ncbi:MAG: hypothetical protein M0R70_15730 [Nitrospirae bacterium]|nr:hypothetical protein [Nitrospirota bacterium]
MRGKTGLFLAVLLAALTVVGCGDLSRDKAASVLNKKLKGSKLTQMFFRFAGDIHTAPGGEEVVRLLSAEGYVKQDKQTASMYVCTQKGNSIFCPYNGTDIEFATFESVAITGIQKNGDTRRVVSYTATYKPSGLLGTMYKDGRTFTRGGTATFSKFDDGWRH